MKTTLRALVVMLTLVLLAAPLAAEAQQAWKIPRIGFLSLRSPSDVGRLAAFRQGLRELGYVEGQNIAIESRWAEGKYDRLPGLAAELVRLKVDVIVTYAAPAIRAARRATGTIPIVMAGAIDPVASGLVTSVARPGGNITGLSLMAPELVGKQLEILIPAWACRRDGRRRPWIPGAHRFRETMEPSARSAGHLRALLPLPSRPVRRSLVDTPLHQPGLSA